VLELGRAQAFKIGFLVSNQAYCRGRERLQGLGGARVAITAARTPLALHRARVVEKDGVDLKTVRVLAAQSNPNVASAADGGQADGAVQTAVQRLSLWCKRDARMLGWVGDELPPAERRDLHPTKARQMSGPETVKHFPHRLPQKGERTGRSLHRTPAANARIRRPRPNDCDRARKRQSRPKSSRSASPITLPVPGLDQDVSAWRLVQSARHASRVRSTSRAHRQALRDCVALDAATNRACELHTRWD